MCDAIASSIQGGNSFSSTFLDWNYIRIRVINADGAGIAPVNVNINDSDLATDGDGYITWQHVPSATCFVTISKDGYQTKTIKCTMDRKREEVEALEPEVSWIRTLGGRIVKNLDVTDGQNKFKWLRL